MAQRLPSRGAHSMIRFRCFWKTTIYDVLKARQWVETESDLDWDLFWSDVSWMHEVFDQVHLAEHQRVNHFRNYFEVVDAGTHSAAGCSLLLLITRKDLLVKNLKRMKRILEKENRRDEAAKYDFSPQTYSLPAEYGLFVEQFKKTPQGVWIMKPVGKAQGKGIFLFTKLSQISEWKKDYRWKAESPQVENYIVQKYIDNPYLVGGKKFDIRLYVLVLSYAPLKAYLYRSGFARFTNTHFSMKKEDIENNYVHLTNFSIQKHAPTYDPKNGTKWSLHSLKLDMIMKHGEQAVNNLFHSIQMLIVRSLLAVQNVFIQDKHCFELYGYDILIDQALKPWLIEVNASPSLAADTPSDYDLKFGMLDDLLTVVDMERRLASQASLKQVGGFDLIIDQGNSNGQDFESFTVLLGCHNDRIQQLKKLFGAQVRHKSIARS